jgi:hypothetical protein
VTGLCFRRYPCMLMLPEYAACSCTERTDKKSNRKATHSRCEIYQQETLQAMHRGPSQGLSRLHWRYHMLSERQCPAAGVRTAF